MKRSRAAVLVTAATLAVLAAPNAASAVPVPSEPIAQGLVGPLQIDVGSDGQIYVAQDFIGVLTKIRANGTTKDIVAIPGEEIAGVASRGYEVAFTNGNGTETSPPTGTFLKVRHTNGTVRTIANLLKVEQNRNPDAHQTYGFKGLSAECVAELPAELGPAAYPGIVDSHPYAVANAPDGGWFVADAGGNDVLHVSRTGKVHVVAVLPPQPTLVTAEAAAANGLPECTIGSKYRFEPVPTDVEVGQDGRLYVSLLPGGPEDPSLGARGSVVRINPVTGHQRVIGRGFLGATNVAVTPRGKVFVAELFGNRISTIKDGWAKGFVDLPSPASVEYSQGMLYASVDVFGNGSVVTIPL